MSNNNRHSKNYLINALCGGFDRVGEAENY
jgi:hypothetical protein